MSTWEKGTPSWLVTSWARVVSWPWPWRGEQSHIPHPRGEDGDGAGGVDADVGDFVEAGAGAERADDGRGGDAAGFEIGGEADAAELAFGGGGGFAGREAGVIGVLHGDFHRREVVAAVVLQGDRGLVREGVLGDEVL